ncbi:MAG: ParA family protein [Acaryochloridaceae cyanobacterium RL_2_7]|nr:ParA family protein [Acaryochloridaceae cyanobacterium RL_2_7]
MAPKSTLVDADPQASCSIWSDRRTKKEPDFLEALLSRVPSKLKALDSAVVDLPGACVPGLQGVLKASDILIVPITYDQSCFDALPATLELALGSGTPTVVVVNRLNPKSSFQTVQEDVEAIINEICTELQAESPAVCPHPLRERVANKDWWPLGEAAADHKQTQSFKEMQKIYKWLKTYG